MSTNINIETIIETKKDAEGKNKTKIYCTFCPSKMLNAGTASLTNMEVSIVYITIVITFQYRKKLHDTVRFFSYKLLA